MMPLFYLKDPEQQNELITLEEDTSKHIVQVLRMTKGEYLQLTDGKGNLFTGEITDDHKKRVVVRIYDTEHKEHGARNITIAISLLKNANRFEWFLEKATEIGITEIIPMICERTERQHFRFERTQNILLSAMLQSHQYWLPQLHEPLAFNEVVERAGHLQKFVAHCIDEKKNNLVDLVKEPGAPTIILIGPEGDFSKQEVEWGLQHQFLPASLGENRLRAETAGVVAATLLMLG